MKYIVLRFEAWLNIQYPFSFRYILWPVSFVDRFKKYHESNRTLGYTYKVRSTRFLRTLATLPIMYVLSLYNISQDHWLPPHQMPVVRCYWAITWGWLKIFIWGVRSSSDLSPAHTRRARSVPYNHCVYFTVTDYHQMYVNQTSNVFYPLNMESSFVPTTTTTQQTRDKQTKRELPQNEHWTG